MATKKECDRCKKQWVPNLDKPLGYEERGDYQLCLISLNIPYDRSRVRNHSEKVEETIEVCQSCAREILSFIRTTPDKEKQ